MKIHHTFQKEYNQLIPLLKKAIVESFNSGDWKELGYTTGCSDIIHNNSRLLKSLNWSDQDYDECVFDALEHMLENESANKEIILGHQKIKSWIENTDPASYQKYYPDPGFVSPAKLKNTSTRQVVETALRDAELLITGSGPVSAVDRVHTALHGFLIELCDKHSITCAVNANITQLYKSLRENVTILKDLEAHGGEVGKIVRSLSSILDAMNPIRNYGSVAHPNQNLIGEAEAKLFINSARTIFHYLDEKL